MTNFEKVREFMLACDQDVENDPIWSSLSNFRYRLIYEELGELREALDTRDIVSVADALTDILYVVYGAGHAFGIDLDKCFDEVHASNMTKCGSDGKVLKNEHGKVMKGSNYTPPNLESVLFNRHT